MDHRQLGDAIRAEIAAEHFRRAAKLFRRLIVLSGFPRGVVPGINQVARELHPQAASAAEALCLFAAPRIDDYLAICEDPPLGWDDSDDFPFQEGTQ